MANSGGPDQTAHWSSLIWVCTVCSVPVQIFGVTMVWIPGLIMPVLPVLQIRRVTWIIKGRFLTFRRYHNFANLFSKLSETTFYKEISKFQ